MCLLVGVYIYVRNQPITCPFQYSNPQTEDGKESSLARLQNDASAPWDNAKDADKWNKPDWSFLANFPSLPNSAAGKAHGKSEKQKEAVKVRMRA